MVRRPSAVTLVPPACSTRKLIGFASYISRSTRFGCFFVGGGGEAGTAATTGFGSATMLPM